MSAEYTISWQGAFRIAVAILLVNAVVGGTAYAIFYAWAHRATQI